MRRLRLITALSCLIFLSTCSLFDVEQYNPFKRYPVYTGNDLGLTYTPQQSTFKVYAPEVDAVYMNFYEDGVVEESYLVDPMLQEENGVWATQR